MRDIDLLQTKVPGELIDIALRGAKPPEFAIQMIEDAQAILAALDSAEKELLRVPLVRTEGEVDGELRELVRRSDALIVRTLGFAEGQSVDTPEFASYLSASAARIEHACNRVKAMLAQAEG